jgi:hypothetical protein
LSFGVIADDTMGDSAKVTVIATGFAKLVEKRESPIEPMPASEFFTDRIFIERAPNPVPSAPMAETVEAEMQRASAFEEDLDVPAYLRQGKLLN